ncbi:hypothetical protein [Hydrogenophaga intermedia]|uniref:hypothetical protein n=1 Tax=Hydrogenophaga intermedia TaxID=65786 RepID=UPI0020447BBD|nr:hypothetical protein [Hydrogenophaga intermedia]MCM3565198.1 hypothetical protein [Hydrogenophaga intermedia]
MLGLRFKPRPQPGGNPPADASALPADLVACIESCTVYQRHAGSEGDVRAIVQLDGRGWVHNDEDTRNQLLRRWPELTETQLRRAVRHVGAKVRQACAPAPAARQSWVRNW